MKSVQIRAKAVNPVPIVYESICIAPLPCIQKENNTMENMEQTQRRYIRDRLWVANSNKADELRLAFGVSDALPPATAEELIDRIKNGQYVLREKGDWDDSPLDRIRWRDPLQKEDRDGLKAAHARRDAAQQNVNDQAMLASIADAHKALNDFEATDFRNG